MFKAFQSPIALICATLFTNAALAGTMHRNPVDTKDCNSPLKRCRVTRIAPVNWVVILSGGPGFEHSGQTQTFYMDWAIEKTWVASNKNQNLGIGEFFVGSQQPISSGLQGQLGLAINVGGNAKPGGIIWDDAVPEFDNHAYSYKIFHTHAALKGKLLLQRVPKVIPWVSAAAGVGLNRASGYENIPLIPEALPHNNFTSNNKIAFSWTVGAGFQFPICKDWEVGLSYEFADWGQSELGRAAQQTLNSGLHESHMFVNGLLFNVTYTM